MSDDDIFCGVSVETAESSADAHQLRVTSSLLGKRAREQDSLDPQTDGSRQDARAVSPTFSYAVDIAVSEDKGSRQDMEDVWVVIPDARTDKTSTTRAAVCCVLDGHAGRRVAAYVGNNLPDAILKAGLFSHAQAAPARRAAGMRAAVANGFQAMDRRVLEECRAHGWNDGAACVTAWVVADTVVIANIGDAKGVLARLPECSAQNQAAAEAKAITLTREHKAIFASERARIAKSSGQVVNGRLEGKIEISRSFGDLQYKQSGMTAQPDVTIFDLTPRDQFLLLGCDGFWNVFNANDATAFASKLAAQGATTKHICNRLINEAVRGRHCKDNCTVAIMRFTS